jgi:tRNA A37 threonylcarbamoyladenosine dehydratase
MNDLKLHETLYRGEEWLERFAVQKITLCGAGAIGSLLADNLTRMGLTHLRVIDDDRVERHNVGTQLFGEADIGGFKVDALRAHCFRTTGTEIEIIKKRLVPKHVKKMLRDCTLVVDTFDNHTSRKLVAEHCEQTGIACLHLGMNADYGEVRWNDRYRVPSDVLAGDICEYPLARNLILLVIAVGSEALLNYCKDGRKEEYEITLRDLYIHRSCELDRFKPGMNGVEAMRKLSSQLSLSGAVKVIRG